MWENVVRDVYSLEDLARGAAVLVLPLLAHRARGHRIRRPPETALRPRGDLAADF